MQSDVRRSPAGTRVLLDGLNPRKEYICFLVEGSLDDAATTGRTMAFESALFRTGLPIPPVFVITATKSHEFFDLGRRNPILWDRCKKAVCELEAQADQKFAITLHDCTYGYDPRKPPLFLNVEADCIVPLRGHQARVVDIGMNDHIVEYCASTFGSPGAIYRSYAKFLESYGTYVLNVPDRSYRNVIRDICNRRGTSAVRKFSTEDWKEVVRRFKRITAAPQDPYQQLACALEAVYSPWCSAEGMVEGEHCGAERRAAVEAGIAVCVQAAVSGGGEQSGAGIAHVHNGELRTVSFAPGAETEDLPGLLSAEGEDGEGTAAAGVLSAAELEQWNSAVCSDLKSAARVLGEIYPQGQLLEVNFVVQTGTLFLTSVNPPLPV